MSDSVYAIEKLAALAERGTPEPLSKFLTALEVLQFYLSNILGRDLGKLPTREYVFDWEMLYEAVYSESSDAVYSGAIWYGLERLQELRDPAVKAYVVVPEGTRMELFRHLQWLLSDRPTIRHYSMLLSASKASSFLPSGDFKRKDWERVWLTTEHILELQDHRRRIAQRIAGVLRTYTRPMPYHPKELLTEDIHFYRGKLDRLRPDERSDEGVNVADSFNLASVEKLLRDSNVGYHYCPAIASGLDDNLFPFKDMNGF